MILLIDNYDSFVYNLARFFQRLGQPTQVVRNDAIDPPEVARRRPDAVVISPGPAAPAQAGCSLEIVQQLHRELPLLGVCLGHQAIAAAFGGKIVRSEPCHGRTSLVEHAQAGLFAGIASPMRVGRYHSLAVELASLPECLEPIGFKVPDSKATEFKATEFKATDEEATQFPSSATPAARILQTDTFGGTELPADKLVMALRHRHYPVFGVQFHPESILTADGYRLLANFLAAAGVSCEADPAALARTEGPPPEGGQVPSSYPVATF